MKVNYIKKLNFYWMYFHNKSTFQIKMGGTISITETEKGSIINIDGKDMSEVFGNITRSRTHSRISTVNGKTKIVAGGDIQSITVNGEKCIPCSIFKDDPKMKDIYKKYCS